MEGLRMGEIEGGGAEAEEEGEGEGKGEGKGEEEWWLSAIHFFERESKTHTT